MIRNIYVPYDALTRNMTNQELANRVLSNPQATAMELALANKLLDADADLESAQGNQCSCD